MNSHYQKRTDERKGSDYGPCRFPIGFKGYFPFQGHLSIEDKPINYKKKKNKSLSFEVAVQNYCYYLNGLIPNINFST